MVANGCTDDTAQIAGRYGPGSGCCPSRCPPSARPCWPVTGPPRASRGSTWTRTWSSGRRTCAPWPTPLARPGALAAGPERVLALSGASWLVRWYYDVWARLPEVRSGLFGRGVIALSEAGHARVASLPPLLADDLAASLVFGPDERVIVPGARVVVHVPRTAGDLLRRRVRAAMGVNQVEQAEGGSRGLGPDPAPGSGRPDQGRAVAGAAGGGVPRGRRRGPPPGPPRSAAEPVLDVAAGREQPRLPAQAPASPAS